MKRLFHLLAGGAAIILLTSCLPKKQMLSPRLKVVTTTPVIYDWTRNIIDENSNTTLYLSLVIKNGFNYHDYIPSEPEEETIEKADLFIFTGGTSEQWAQKLAGTNSLNLTEIQTYDNSFSAADEHFVLCPQNAIICCQKICEKICELDPANAEKYKSKCQDYIAQLELLDSAFQLTAQKATSTTFVFCDRFPFKCLFDFYGFNYSGMYDDCPAPLNLSKDQEKEKAAQLGKKIDELGANAVYVMEDSDKKLAKTVIGYSKNPKCDTVVLDSMESATLSQLFNGKNYINTLRNDLTLLQLN